MDNTDKQFSDHSGNDDSEIRNIEKIREEYRREIEEQVRNKEMECNERHKREIEVMKYAITEKEKMVREHGDYYIKLLGEKNLELRTLEGDNDKLSRELKNTIGLRDVFEIRAAIFRKELKKEQKTIEKERLQMIKIQKEFESEKEKLIAEIEENNKKKLQRKENRERLRNKGYIVIL